MSSSALMKCRNYLLLGVGEFRQNFRISVVTSARLD